MTNLAILGTGHMGTAMALRLLSAGHRVTAWNRATARTVALADAGAEIAATAAEAVAGADLVITMLTDAAAVESVLLGPAAAALQPGTIVVQMSTISPDEVRTLAARLPERVSFLDAPVGGSVGAAETGALTIFAGGPPPVLDSAEPVLRALGTIRRCGPVGAGAALKLVVNAAMVTALGALHDTLAVADAVGVDRATALDALDAGPLGGAIKRATMTTASFAISLAAKDGRLALHATRTAPVVAAAIQLLHAATDQEADVAELINLETR